MNHHEAKEMAAAIAVLLPGATMRVDHRGFYCTRTPEIEMDGQWEVWATVVNAKSGNVSSSYTREYTADPKEIARFARRAGGKATAADRAAYARMEAERACNET